MRWSERAPAAGPHSLSLAPFPFERHAPSSAVAHLVLVRPIRVRRFDLSDKWQADCSVSETFRVGEIYHVARNSAGGATLTPIARFFVWRPIFVEGFNSHWRVDCFVRQHPLSPEPMPLGESLVDALLRERLCDGPIWMSAYTSRELEGKAYGDIFEQE